MKTGRDGEQWNYVRNSLYSKRLKKRKEEETFRSRVQGHLLINVTVHVR